MTLTMCVYMYIYVYIFEACDWHFDTAPSVALHLACWCHSFAIKHFLPHFRPFARSSWLWKLMTWRAQIRGLAQTHLAPHRQGGERSKRARRSLIAWKLCRSGVILSQGAQAGPTLNSVYLRVTLQQEHAIVVWTIGPCNWTCSFHLNTWTVRQEQATFARALN